jgi:hypothetical protein
MRLPHPFRHAAVQRVNHICHIPAPHQLRGPGNLKALPFEDILQPIQQQVVGELAGHDVGQQPRTDRCLSFRRRLDLGIFSGALTAATGIFLPRMS